MKSVFIPIAIMVSPLIATANELDDLLRRVPGTMNTVAVINVAAINQSPRAVREGWAKNHETEYLAGAVSVPTWAKFVVLSSELYPGALAEARSLALIPADNSTSAEGIAKRENGTVQNVGNRTMVLSPRRGYIAVPAPGIVGISSNMQRQEFAKWIAAANKPSKMEISPYIQTNLSAKKANQIVIAIDMNEIIEPTRLKQELLATGGFDGNSIDTFTRVFSGIRGLVLTIDVEEKTIAEARIDFSVDMAQFASYFKLILPKGMELMGMNVDELKNAPLKANGKSVVMKAELSDESLRKLLSVLSAPGDAIGTSETTTIRTPREAAKLAASLRFYKAVNSTLDDLKSQSGPKSTDYVKSATWYETYAAKLEKTPIEDVDPELLQYGASVVNKLRGIATSLRGVKVQVDAYESYKSVTAVSSGGLWRWGGGSVAMDSNVSEMASKQAALVAKLEPERIKIWEVLQSDRSTLRRNMLEKYKIDFDQYKK